MSKAYYRLTETIRLTPAVGDLFLSEEQVARVAHRRIHVFDEDGSNRRALPLLGKGKARGSHRINGDPDAPEGFMDFKRGELVGLSAPIPKTLWDAFEGEPGEHPTPLTASGEPQTQAA